MSRKSKLVFWLTLSGVSAIVAAGASYLYLTQKSPLTFGKMDFDQNGFVTFSELIYASSYGTRQVTENDMSCTEYYALKDGAKLKVICDGDEL